MGLIGILLIIIIVWVFVAKMSDFSKNISKENRCGPDESNKVIMGECEPGWFRNYAKIIKCKDSEDPIEQGCLKENYICCYKKE